MKKRLLIATGGGDCPGLNAVIRAIVKRASKEHNWEVLGSIDAFDGILRDPMHLVELSPEKVAGIHVMGGTIIGTTNKGGPFAGQFRTAMDPGILLTAARTSWIACAIKTLMPSLTSAVMAHNEYLKAL
jgi:6-phosphofructokinase